MSSQRGFSMIEVLVSLLLICIGVLGMVALQSKAIPYTQDSVQRSNAAMLANDLLELIRSKPDEVGNYLKAKEAAFPSTPASCVPLPGGAKERLGCWAGRVRAILPGAAELMASEFYICKTISPRESGSCTVGSALEIQLAWKTPKGECLDAGKSEDENKDNTTCRYRLRTEL